MKKWPQNKAALSHHSFLPETQSLLVRPKAWVSALHGPARLTEMETEQASYIKHAIPTHYVTFMHLPGTFIQSDLQYIQDWARSGPGLCFSHSLGTEPMTLVLLTPCHQFSHISINILDSHNIRTYWRCPNEFSLIVLELSRDGSQ